MIAIHSWFRDFREAVRCGRCPTYYHYTRCYYCGDRPSEHTNTGKCAYAPTHYAVDSHHPEHPLGAEIACTALL